MNSAVPWAQIAAVLGGVAGFLLFALIIALRRLSAISARLDDETFRRQSLSTSYGRITEQWFPLLKSYPYEPQDFRFLGSPVDGVQFNEDSVIFIEFKANKSRLSEKQRRIKKLVEEGHVYWEEFHFTDEE